MLGPMTKISYLVKWKATTHCGLNFHDFLPQRDVAARKPATTRCGKTCITQRVVRQLYKMPQRAVALNDRVPMHCGKS